MRLSQLFSLTSVTCAQAVNITAYRNVPSGASTAVDHAFPGFGIESTSFPDFTKPFSQNLFNAIAKRTGSPVIIRIGGTSMYEKAIPCIRKAGEWLTICRDHSIFDLHQNKTTAWPNGKGGGLQSNITFGAPWFDGLGTLNNTKYIMAYALARHRGTNYTNSVEFIQHSLDTMGPDKLQAVEIGNEVDIFAAQNWRNDFYTAQNYAKEAKSNMDLFASNITNLPEGRMFQIFDRSSENDRARWKMSVKDPSGFVYSLF